MTKDEAVERCYFKHARIAMQAACDLAVGHSLVAKMRRIEVEAAIDKNTKRILSIYMDDALDGAVFSYDKSQILAFELGLLP